MATGALDTNGIWQYGEDDSETTFSALLNKLASSTSNQLKPGRIIKTVSFSSTTVTSVSSSSFQNTSVTTSITPSSVNSKILVLVNASIETSGANSVVTGTLFRGTVAGTNLGDGTNGFGRLINGGSYLDSIFSLSYLDTPATTSSTQYMFAIKSSSGTAYLNPGKATITLMEVVG